MQVFVYIKLKVCSVYTYIDIHTHKTHGGVACGVEKKHGEDVCLVALPAAWEGNARVECAWRQGLRRGRGK